MRKPYGGRRHNMLPHAEAPSDLKDVLLALAELEMCSGGLGQAMEPVNTTWRTSRALRRSLPPTRWRESILAMYSSFGAAHGAGQAVARSRHRKESTGREIILGPSLL